MGISSIDRDVRDSASRLYEQNRAKIGKKQWVYAFTFFGGPAAQEGEAVTRIRKSKQRSLADFFFFHRLHFLDPAEAIVEPHGYGS